VTIKKRIIVLLGCAVIFTNFGSHTNLGKIPAPTVRFFSDNRDAALVEDLSYSVGQSGISITVPRGYVTDFASIPRPLWPLLSPHASYSKAAVVHDLLYWAQDCTREEADRLLLTAMVESDVSLVLRWTIYIFVRALGWYAWRANQQERANGVPRVIPSEFLQIPPDLTGIEYRKLLKARGVKDPVFPKDAPYCHLGKTTAVPNVSTAVGTNRDKPSESLSLLPRKQSKSVRKQSYHGANWELFEPINIVVKSPSTTSPTLPINFPLVSKNPCQQISQPVSRQNHRPISNPACINNVSRRKHGSRRDNRTIHSPGLRNPNPPTVTVSDLRRDLEALFSPRLKVGARKFG
jgi:Protein of unknown function (DUF1353)